MSKTILLIFCLALSFTLSQAQSAKEMLAEIEGKWELDDNGNVSFVEILELPGMAKDEIYTRALNYFIYNYKDAASVIQSKDKEGGVVIGKGIYKKAHIGQSLSRIYVDTWHILRVEAKDNKARVTISLTEYDLLVGGVNGGPPSSYSTRVGGAYPVDLQGGQKTIMTKAFYKSYLLALATLKNVEKTIKEGNTSKAIESDKWR